MTISNFDDQDFFDEDIMVLNPNDEFEFEDDDDFEEEYDDDWDDDWDEEDLPDDEDFA